jgi:hypothetical protein
MSITNTMSEKKVGAGKLRLIGVLVLLLTFGLSACSSEKKAEENRPKAGLEQGRREGRGGGRGQRRPGFKSEFSLRSRPAFIKLREYEEREKRGETLPEEEAAEYQTLKDRIKEMREKRGPGRGGLRRERPTRGEMESLKEIGPPLKAGPDKYRGRIEEIEREYGPEKAEELRAIFRKFMDEARKIRQTFPDNTERRREEIRKLGMAIEQEADAYIRKLEKEKK